MVYKDDYVRRSEDEGEDVASTTADNVLNEADDEEEAFEEPEKETDEWE